MTIKEAQIALKKALMKIYDPIEAQNISHWVMESITGMKKIDRLVNEHTPFTDDQEKLWQEYQYELLRFRPVQYVLGESYFQGHRFFVKEGVLIPRPETEELVEWVIADYANKTINLLDVGTGSGCIPISLQLRLKNAVVSSVDISEKALEIAQYNAHQLNANVKFLQRDFLQWEKYDWEPIDVLVSNPPYIPQQEKETMMVQVTDHEPSLALFVPNDHPLIFYERIAEFGKKYLKEGGAIYVEIHEDLGTVTCDVFNKGGYKSVQLRKDFQGRDRMIKAQLK